MIPIESKSDLSFYLNGSIVVSKLQNSADRLTRERTSKIALLLSIPRAMLAKSIPSLNLHQPPAQSTYQSLA
jgi:hypothetical protein